MNTVQSLTPRVVGSDTVSDPDTDH